MIRQLTPSELKARLDKGEPLYILDVREPWEVAICSLPNSHHIPMREIPARINELPRDTDNFAGSEIGRASARPEGGRATDGAPHLVVLCHHGVRSQYVASFLERLGFERLHNLAGGIDAWAKDVEPAMAKY